MTEEDVLKRLVEIEALLGEIEAQVWNEDFAQQRAALLREREGLNSSWLLRLMGE